MDKENGLTPYETREILFYKTDNGDVRVEILLYQENLWLTQAKMADLFDVQKAAISKHLKNIFESGELSETSVVSKMETTVADGKRYNMNYYNLDAIIAVGYRVNSKKATMFRIWANHVLKEFIIKGYVMDDVRLREPENFFGKDYFEEQLERIRKSDVSIAKNYLNETEMSDLNEIVTMYLDYAERQARRGNIMYMQDWAERLDAFLQFNEEDVLQNKGKVTAAIAKTFAESEFEKYRVLQDRSYQSDFDRLIADIEENSNEFYQQ